MARSINRQINSHHIVDENNPIVNKFDDRESANLRTGLTPVQHNALKWLCAVRHQIHIGADDFWLTESPDHQRMWELISDDINNVLVS